jgi:hypothetical protein
MAGRPAPSAAPRASRGRSRISSPAPLPIVSTTIDAHTSRPRGTQHAPSFCNACPSPACRWVDEKADSSSVRIPGQVDLLSVAMKGPLVPCLDKRTRHQETLRVDGIQCRRPPAKQRVPFVRGCVPKDVDPSHDKGRVQSLRQRMASTTATPCISAQVVSCSIAEGPGLRLLFSCLPETAGSASASPPSP